MLRFIFTAFIIISLGNGFRNHALADSALELAKAGITARFDPEQARPGDIVTLQVQMQRDSWGQFELQIPKHPNLHSIAIEKIPLSLSEGRYQQRISWLFQPISSGEIRLQDASVTLSSQDGTQTIGLPTLLLQVQPFANQELTDTPLPLPPNDEAYGIHSGKAWIVGLAAIIGVGVFVAFLRSLRIPPTPANNADQSGIDRTQLITAKLITGNASREELVGLLNDPNFVASTPLRLAMEKAAYSQGFQSSELAALAAKELSS